MITIKCTVVGDTRVGKTMLINTLVNFRGQKPRPTLVDNYTTVFSSRSENIRLSIWDVGGDSSNKRLRSLSYQQSDIFILCYAVSDLTSFANLPSWYDEIKRYSVPIILCGTKCDEGAEVLEDMVVKLRKKYGLVKAHLCCSAVHKINVKAVFEKAVSVIEQPEIPRNRFCCC